MTRSYFAIVPAAGVGSRMNRDLPKQYLTIDGNSVLERSVGRLLQEPKIESVTVCIAKSDAYWSRSEISGNARVKVAPGGDSRAESVLNGLSSIAHVAQPDDWVLVHDAARPCLSKTTLQRLILETENHHCGGILAIPARDTLKMTANSQAQRVVKTLDRSRIWQAQTPQMFKYGLLNNALATAIKCGQEITDEASAMESAGHEVLLVAGESSNIKITTPDDLIIAAALLQSHNQNKLQ